MFSKRALACLLALTSISAAASSSANVKRAAVDDVTVYAYGSDINGAPVFYSDGLAYIGRKNPGWSSTSLNVTFSTADGTSTSEPWNIAANLTDANNTTAPFTANSLSFYIVPTTDSFSQAGFVSNSSVPTGGVTTGFLWYGTQVAYSTGTDLELQFWAQTTNVSGVYSLHWDSNTTSTATDDIFPVSLKSTPPTSNDKSKLLV